MRLKHTVGFCIGGLWGTEPTRGVADINVIRVADFDYAHLSAQDAPTKRSVPQHLSAVRRLETGDLLIEKSGGGERTNVGRVVRWSGETEAISSNFVSVMRPAPGYDSRFLVLLHRALYFSGHADACTKQNTGIQNLDLSAYLSVNVLIPSEQDQREIASRIFEESSRIDELVTETVGLQDTLREETRGLFRVLVTRNCEPRSVPLRRCVRSIADGPFGSSLASAHYIESPEVRVVRLGNIGSAEFLDEGRAFVASAYAEAALAEHFLEPGQVVMAGLGDDRNPLGRACVVPATLGPAMHKADCYRLEVEPSRVLPEFLAIALSFGPARDAAPLLSRGSTRARLNTVVAKDLPIPSLPVSEQAGLVEEFEARRACRNRISAELEGLRRDLADYRDALITEAVTGKLDVTKLSESRMTESLAAVREGERPEVLSS